MPMKVEPGWWIVEHNKLIGGPYTRRKVSTFSPIVRGHCREVTTAEAAARSDGITKPCPFCGGWNLHAYQWPSQRYSVACRDCRADGPLAEDREQAAEKWNTRA